MARYLKRRAAAVAAMRQPEQLALFGAVKPRKADVFYLLDEVPRQFPKHTHNHESK